MAETAGDRSHPATPYRRRKAREEGQVARSTDLASAVVLTSALLALRWVGPRGIEACLALVSEYLGTAPALDGSPLREIGQASGWLFRTLAPFLGLVLLAAVAAHVGQVGWLFVPSRLAPQLSRISPVAGWRRIFSMAGLVRLFLGLGKVAVVATVAGATVYAERERIVSLAALDFRPQCATLADILLSTCLYSAVALLVLAVLDYAWQRWKYEQDLRMTTQELRDEYKMLQGDPQIAARRKQIQQQIVQSRLTVAVPKADVVITNPTELAIALQYEPEQMEAPIVVAKGAGALAARIRRLALEHGVPVLERKELARALYRHVDVNRPIPAAYYTAVAEILRYVYQLKGKTLPRR